MKCLFFDKENKIKFYLLVNKEMLDFYQENIGKGVIENEKESLKFLSKYLDDTGLYSFNNNIFRKIKRKIFTKRQ